MADAVADGRVAVTDAAVVRRVVGRLAPRELLALAARWDPQAHAAAVRGVRAKSKKSVTAVVADTVLGGATGAAARRAGQRPDQKNRLTYKQLAQVDLTYAQAAGIKRWKTLLLVYQDRRPPPLDALYLTQRLTEALSAFFTVHTHAALHDDAMWIRLAFYETAGPFGLPSAANVVLMVYYPHTHYLLTTAIKAVHREFVQQALLRTFDCERVEDTDLKGRNPAALGDLVMNRNSQGPLSHYRLSEVDPNPLDRKRRRTDSERASVVDPAAAGAIVAEDQENQRALDRNVRAQFGSHALPALDAIRIDLKASFQPNQALGVFPCIIRFEGPNVLEGLRELIPRGATVGRLPKFLATLPEQLTSHLTVTDDDISM